MACKRSPVRSRLAPNHSIQGKPEQPKCDVRTPTSVGRFPSVDHYLGRTYEPLGRTASRNRTRPGSRSWRYPKPFASSTPAPAGTVQRLAVSWTSAEPAALAQGERGADEREVAERLREVSKLTPGQGVVFLREEADVVAEIEKQLE